MKNLPLPYQESVEDWYPIFGKKTIRCKKFNRRKCWDSKDNQKWLESLGKGHIINPLIYVDIDSCILFCISIGKHKDVKYFQGYKDLGYVYLTLEGGNRHDATEEIYNEYPMYREKNLNIVVVESIDRKEMHDLYLNLAGGKAPNDQEKRTGIYGKVSDVVRKTSEDLVSMWDKVKGITKERMDDDLMVAMIMNYVTNGSFGKHPITGKKGVEVLDSLYETSEYNTKRFNYVTDNLKKFWDNVTKWEIITSKQYKVIIYLLSVLFSEFQNAYKISKKKKFINEFFDYFNNIYKYDHDEKGETRIRFKNGDGSYTYKNLLGNMLMNLSILDEVEFLVRSELIPILENKGVIVPINTEEFTFSHRKEYIGKNKFEKNGNLFVTIRTNNSELTLLPGESEFKDVSITEAFSNRCELDHIIPKSKDGKTIIENAELTSKEYNRKKSDKEINEN